MNYQYRGMIFLLLGAFTATLFAEPAKGPFTKIGSTTDWSDFLNLPTDSQKWPEAALYNIEKTGAKIADVEKSVKALNAYPKEATQLQAQKALQAAATYEVHSLADLFLASFYSSKGLLNEDGSPLSNPKALASVCGKSADLFKGFKEKVKESLKSEKLDKGEPMSLAKQYLKGIKENFSNAKLGTPQSTDEYPVAYSKEVMQKFVKAFYEKTDGSYDSVSNIRYDFINATTAMPRWDLYPRLNYFKGHIRFAAKGTDQKAFKEVLGKVAVDVLFPGEKDYPADGEKNAIFARFEDNQILATYPVAEETAFNIAQEALETSCSRKYVAFTHRDLNQKREGQIKEIVLRAQTQTPSAATTASFMPTAPEPRERFEPMPMPALPTIAGPMRKPGHN